MATNHRQPKGASDQTDAFLRAERQEADEEFALNGRSAEKRAHELVDRAREQADEILGSARAKADTKLQAAGASRETLAASAAERTDADAILDTERMTADFLLESERLERNCAAISLLRVGRGQTDEHLLLERALFDERLVRILAELSEALRVRDEFIAVASHELKTPLTPLALRLQSLAREAARQPDSHFAQQVNAHVGTAMQQLRRFSALIADLLDVSRITSGKLTLELGTVDLGAVVTRMAARIGLRAKAAGCDLTVDAPRTTGRWDELLLDQAVASLLENGIKYGRGMPIRVWVQATPETARLMVQDAGIGIAPEDLSRIFGRFERAVSDRNYGGLGLGLFTAKAIVEAMDGTLSVQSESGQGSTFTIELPRSGPADRTPRPGVGPGGESRSVDAATR